MTSGASVGGSGRDPNRGAEPPELETDTLITSNDTALPTVYDCLHSMGSATAVAIGSRIGSDRQVVHGNLDRLVAGGLAARHTDATYRLVRPTLDPTVVQSLTELGSSLRRDLCALAVDEEPIVVDDARTALDLSASNARKILNDLADDGYLTKREGTGGRGLVTYRVTGAGERELAALDDPTEYLGRDGRRVGHYAGGIEATAFRTAYEIEDVHVLARLGSATVDELLAETSKAEKATRRRLDRLVERGLLETARRRARNAYRPTPQTRTMIDAVRRVGDERRRRYWKRTVPDACRDRLDEPFFPEGLFRVLSDAFAEATPGLADELLTAWKDRGLVYGNRRQGFHFSDGEP